MIAGGGTGGHLFPAIAVAEGLRALKPDSEIMFIGTRRKIEARVVPEYGFSFRTIWISGFHRRFTLENILFPIKVIVSLMQSLSIIRGFRPDVVLGTGGYVCGPVLYAATLFHIPSLIQEQNSYPGVTTRLLAKRVDEVHLTFERSRRFIAGAKQIFLTGNPTRSGLDKVPAEEAAAYFGFVPTWTGKTILVFGGSLGAHTINEAVRASIAGLTAGGLRIIWQTGEADYTAAKESSKDLPGTLVWVGAFIDRMDCAYRVSDLVVCRAGATTIAELTVLGKPAILIPYPHAAAGHQMENAKSLAEAGAAELVQDHEAKSRLEGAIRAAASGDKLASMAAKSRALGKPDAAREIARRIILLGER